MARSGPDALSWCPTAPRRDPASAGAQAAAAAALRGGVEAAGWPAGGQGVVRHPAADDECDERRHRRHQGHRRQRRRGRQRHPLTWRCPAPSWLAASTVWSACCSSFPALLLSHSPACQPGGGFPSTEIPMLLPAHVPPFHSVLTGVWSHLATNQQQINSSTVWRVAGDRCSEGCGCRQ